MTTQDNLLYSRVVDYDREGVKRVKAELRADFPGAIVRSHKRIVRAGGTSFPVTVILVVAR